MMTKWGARADALRARRSLPLSEVEALSSSIRSRLEGLEEFKRAGTIAVYVSKSDEVQTMSIISAALGSGKRVLAPRSDPSTGRLTFCSISSPSSLVRGAFGVREPPKGSPESPLSEAQVVIVPVVAWDEAGNRLGYGKGFFDRELKDRGDATAIGLAFETQRRDTLPYTPADVHLDMVVTEKRVVDFRSRGR